MLVIPAFKNSPWIVRSALRQALYQRAGPHNGWPKPPKTSSGGGQSIYGMRLDENTVADVTWPLHGSATFTKYIKADKGWKVTSNPDTLKKVDLKNICEGWDHYISLEGATTSKAKNFHLKSIAQLCSCDSMSYDGNDFDFAHFRKQYMLSLRRCKARQQNVLERSS